MRKQKEREKKQKDGMVAKGGAGEVERELFPQPGREEFRLLQG
jgi:hypothetical protein